MKRHTKRILATMALVSCIAGAVMVMIIDPVLSAKIVIGVIAMLIGVAVVDGVWAHTEEMFKKDDTE